MLSGDFNLPNIGRLKNSIDDFLLYEGINTNVLEKTKLICKYMKKLKLKQYTFLSNSVNNTLYLVFLGLENIELIKALESIVRIDDYHPISDIKLSIVNVNSSESIDTWIINFCLKISEMQITFK